MKSLLQWLLLTTLLGLLAGCGPTRESVFPPELSMDQLQVSDDGSWHLALRIQNRSYARMTFQNMEGSLQVTGQIPLRLSQSLQLEVPALSADVCEVTLIPTAALRQALLDSRHSTQGLAYRIAGQITALPARSSRLQTFPFHHDDRFYPVPGTVQRYR